MSTISPHEGGRVVALGRPLEAASSAMILVHGRGATAEGIVDLHRVLPHPEMAYLAPEAAGNSWYPLTFLAELDQNEPDLSSALDVIDSLVELAGEHAISPERVIVGGFSQGACLSSEYIARNPRRYGGALLFSGGLMGPPGRSFDYEGTLAGTPVFVGCSDVDAFIPVGRVEETAAVLADLGATVTKRIYRGMGHTIVPDEIEHARRIVQGLDAT